MGHSADAGEIAGVEIYPDSARLARAGVKHFISLAGEAIATRGRFAAALAGGSTPKAMYSLLATTDYAARVDWARVHVFWGDERCVPPDHPDSNYRMTREALLDHVPLPSGNIHRIRGELEASRAAAEYQQELQDFFHPRGKEAPEGAAPNARFDLTLLGMGEDGHTASLFPGTSAIREQTLWVMAHYVQKLGAWRITFTPALINAAVNVVFVVSGSGKAPRLQQVLFGSYQPNTLPAQIVRPNSGRLLWLVDAAAAALLDGGR